MVAGRSGLIDTATNEAVILSVTAGGVVEGRTAVSVTWCSRSAWLLTVTVTLDQVTCGRAYDPQRAGHTTTLAAADLVTLTATITDKDGDDLGHARHRPEP